MRRSPMTESVDRDFLNEAYRIARGETGPSGLHMLPQVEHLQSLIQEIGKLKLNVYDLEFRLAEKL